jgi:pilus assembly protein CpaE
MRKDAIKCYVSDLATRQILTEAFGQIDSSHEIVDGGIETLIHDAATWAFVPDFIIVDISELSEVDEHIKNFVDVSPPGETEMILIGNSLDIAFYRHLRQLGILDYFAKPIRVEDMIATLRQSVERSRTNRGEISREKLIAVVHASPGAGASTVAHSLAYYLASRQKETFLLDLDIVRGTQYMLAGVNETPGFIDILSSPNRLDKLFLERTRVTPAPKLSLLSANLTPDQKQPSGDSGVNLILSSIRDSVDYVVLDTTANPLVGKTILSQANHLVIVTDPTLVGLRGVSQITMENDLSPNQYITIVINKTGLIKDGAVSRKEFMDRFDLSTIEIPFDPRGPYIAQMRGMDLAKQKDNAIWRNMSLLVQELELNVVADAPSPVGYLQRLLKK